MQCQSWMAVRCVSSSESTPSHPLVSTPSQSYVALPPDRTHVFTTHTPAEHFTAPTLGAEPTEHAFPQVPQLVASVLEDTSQASAGRLLQSREPAAQLEQSPVLAAQARHGHDWCG